MLIPISQYENMSGHNTVCHQIIITIKITILSLLLLTTATTVSNLALVFCLEVSERLLFTKGGRNVYIAKKRAIVKKDRNSDIQKREICLTNFEKGTLIGAIIVILTGLVA